MPSGCAVQSSDRRGCVVPRTQPTRIATCSRPVALLERVPLLSCNSEPQDLVNQGTARPPPQSRTRFEPLDVSCSAGRQGDALGRWVAELGGRNVQRPCKLLAMNERGVYGTHQPHRLAVGVDIATKRRAVDIVANILLIGVGTLWGYQLGKRASPKERLPRTPRYAP